MMRMNMIGPYECNAPGFPRLCPFTSSCIAKCRYSNRRSEAVSEILATELALEDLAAAGARSETRIEDIDR
jgi:hypothetical protein